MQFDDLLLRYFGTTDLAAVAPSAREAGVERMRVDFGLERDPAKRFVIWVLLAMNGAEPDLDVAFEDEAEREAARNLLDLVMSARGD
ncbi:hypothetical protein [Croceicoccus pelagius]|uniref:Uncharacterized protein n=2 Tax=Croceicoccus pelagius TaxID=1703341 RepID=A0A916YD82_9SPHN|nr:hypothetical protein [Croceicoccus pelagius]GGD40209.1 hypothetical protein GCM10010989_13010 [Croceicoccus pelagius]